MASIRLTIRKNAPDNSGRYPICIVYQIGKSEAVFSTGKKTNLLGFDKTNLYNPISASVSGYQEANLHIRNLYNKLNRIVDAYFMANSAYPSADYVKLLWNDNSRQNSRFFDYFDMFLKEYRNNIGTYRNYENLKTKLQEYSDKKPLTFDSLPDNLYQDFADHLKTKYKMLPSSVQHNISLLKSYINWCYIKKFCAKKPIPPKLTSQNKSWHVYLTIEDLRQLNAMKTDFEETKDAFLLQCFLGVRYSDLTKVISERIIRHGENYYFTTKSKKTGKLLQIPITSTAKAIIDKRNGSDWIPDIVQMNKELKLIFKTIPEYTEKVTIARGESDVSVCKYELITTHTARRTFINIMRKLKIDDATISSITGQSMMTLKGYYHPSQDDVQSAMNELQNSI